MQRIFTDAIMAVALASCLGQVAQNISDNKGFPGKSWETSDKPGAAGWATTRPYYYGYDKCGYAIEGG
jgi:hypothetical protein